MNKNEQSYDVIVVGAGNAALTAALAAKEHSVNVAVLELSLIHICRCRRAI